MTKKIISSYTFSWARFQDFNSFLDIFFSKKFLDDEIPKLF
jgi:hypothetical protein